jgi:hypothetical protein
MRKIAIFLLLSAASVLGACSADGGFKNPLDMNAEEKCYNARLGLAVAVANDVDADILAKLQTNIDLLCPAP